MVWRAAVILFAVGFLFGMYGSFAKMNPAETQIYAFLLQLIVSIPLGIYLLKLVLGKEYKTFRVAIIRKEIMTETKS
jgi:hypothetical protein